MTRVANMVLKAPRTTASGSGVVDVVAGVHQRRGDKVAEFAAVVRAAAPDLGVGGGDEHDRAQERGVAEEDGR